MDDRPTDAAACGPDGCAVPAAPATAGAARLSEITAPSRIDIVSDAICPWCWIGKRHLEGALRELAAEGERFEVHWRPFQLNPDMPAGGVERDAYRAWKFGNLERSRELDAQVVAAGAAAGLEFRYDRQGRTPNTVDAHRVIHLAGEQGPAMQDAVVEALFRAYFHDGEDIGDRAVLTEVAAEAGMDRASVAAMLAGEAGVEEVRAEDAGFRKLGLSGVPTFALQGRVLFSGAMPAERMAEAFRRALGILREQGRTG
ncbi:MAG TPA: DsbA family oxidoreductase [Crenalkalicoccus sp.]|nr:DsbA family oxidoreductase [Crenalkalicoccus sp.]